MIKRKSFCPRCGKEVGKETIVCTTCGKKVKTLKSFYYPKNWFLTLLLCLVLGNCGAHRFYTGYVGTGILQMLTFGGLGLWTLSDVCSIMLNRYKDAEGIELFL